MKIELKFLSQINLYKRVVEIRSNFDQNLKSIILYSLGFLNCLMMII